MQGKALPFWEVEANLSRAHERSYCATAGLENIRALSGVPQLRHLRDMARGICTTARPHPSWRSTLPSTAILKKTVTYCSKENSTSLNSSKGVSKIPMPKLKLMRLIKFLGGNVLTFFQ